MNVDRYDDREIIKTNLIESYDLLLEFGRKHLPDKFFLEDIVNKSLRNTIVREMASNTLMHRESTSSYTAKFVIEKKRMYVENANRAVQDGFITVENLEPNPKNPIIASFFRNIGYADQLGSGVRNLFKYSKYYSGAEPSFEEGDIFRIIVPLDDAYSYDFGRVGRETNATNCETNATNCEPNVTDSGVDISLSEDEKKVLIIIKDNPLITQTVLAKSSGISLGTIKRMLPQLQEKGVLVRVGNKRSGKWIVV